MNLINGTLADIACRYDKPLVLEEQNAEQLAEIYQCSTQETEPVQQSPGVVQALKATKKGGVLGKKRGKYQKNSRVTQWRQRVIHPLFPH
jgi:hypothetical protein